jgi:hypothetical protein
MSQPQSKLEAIKRCITNHIRLPARFLKRAKNLNAEDVIKSIGELEGDVPISK